MKYRLYRIYLDQLTSSMLLKAVKRLSTVAHNFTGSRNVSERFG